MKQNDTKQKILDKALELFSEKGYEAVSMDEIAGAVGVKAPSLYNHFSSKKAIFDAIVQSIISQYNEDTNKIDIHVENVKKDIPTFLRIDGAFLFEKLRQVFEYSIENERIRGFRRMMSIEQFQSKEMSALFTKYYVDRLINYHAKIFQALIDSHEISDDDPNALAMMYVAPVLTLIGICDREMDKKEECLEKLKKHVELFYRLIHQKR